MKSIPAPPPRDLSLGAGLGRHFQFNKEPYSILQSVSETGRVMSAPLKAFIGFKIRMG